MSTARDFIAMLDRAAPRLEEDPANECYLCNSVPAGWCEPPSVPAARGPLPIWSRSGRHDTDGWGLRW